MRDFLKSAGKFLGGLVLVVAITCGVLYGFFMAVVTVGHNAMAPTIVLGDRVLVWKTTSFELGQAALCRHPEDPNRFVMGRVVARSGQTVEINRGGSLLINGSSPDEEVHGEVQFTDAERNRVSEMRYAQEFLLGHGYGTFRLTNARSLVMRERRVSGGVFLLSDNRTYVGEDSRSFGPVQPDQCIGRVFMRLTAAPTPDELPNRSAQLLD